MSFFHRCGDGSKLRGEVRSVKDFDPLVLVFYFLGALVGLLLWRLVRMILTN